MAKHESVPGFAGLSKHVEKTGDVLGICPLSKIIDDVIPQPEKKAGLSIGEYFLFAVINRTIDACSKQALPAWFKASAIEEVRPVNIQALNSNGF